MHPQRAFIQHLYKKKNNGETGLIHLELTNKATAIGWKK